MIPQALIERVGRALCARGLHVSTAESCTGGLVAASLVDYPGISAALDEAHVVYANAAKVRYCGVAPETLEAHGAVSPEAAREMAEGLRQRSGADVALSTTGIAGPGGGTAQKPVGLVYLACASPGGTRIDALSLSGDRRQIREQATTRALAMILAAAEGSTMLEDSNGIEKE